ncbi:MAG: translation initiation factor IF-2, partial [Bacteroidales bacterium]|nr:translation initiation factor IF-2 [Bacteroidales bacterium]
ETPKVEKVVETPVEKVAEPVQKQTPSHIETKVDKLKGPKISGQIDLSKFEKKPSQPSENNADHNKKGKRERIHKRGAKIDVTAVNNEGYNKNGGAKKQPQGQKGREAFKFNRTEVDEDAIQKQIKETYARMTEGKGKTKGSKHRREKREIFEQKMQEEYQMELLSSNILKVTEFVTVNELAILMNNTPVTKVIEACMNLGLMVSINQRLDAEALVLVAEEFGYKIEFVTADNQDAIKETVDEPEDLEPRPPIITVMGHVDHGKTSLLDYIRKSNVIAGEAGGITQHIGAYNVKLPDGKHITFLDTPGHEAFTAMRARGAKITDMAIIIVAADDAVMPQTIEAINHAQAAGVPMVFAINKIDKPGANPEKIKEQLAGMNILVEDWGGKYQCQEISAKKGLNVDKLLEKVLLEADLLELKANPNKRAVGTVVESSLDKGRGYLATIMVQSGTLHVGDIMLSGCYTGRVKAMFNERGQKITSAGPSTPVSVLGLNGAPTAGDTFNVLEDEKEAREIANKREQLIRIQGIKTQTHITLEEIGRRIAIGNFKELNLVIKGDVDGSIEALGDSLIKLSTEEVKVNVIHKAVGAISETDIMLAAASNAIIIGFQVRPDAGARRTAEKEGIEIRLYSVIYDAINEVKDGIEGMLAPEEKEEVTATAEVRETFKISKVGTIAGCMVKEGKLVRTSKVRVIRDGIVVYTGVLGSLKRFKDDVKEVASGFDCGLNIEGFNDVKVGDVVEAYQIVEIKRKL